MNFHQLLQEVVQSYVDDGISPEQINEGYDPIWGNSLIG